MLQSPFKFGFIAAKQHVSPNVREARVTLVGNALEYFLKVGRILSRKNKVGRILRILILRILSRKNLRWLNIKFLVFSMT